MNLARIYAYRFARIDPQRRLDVWREIARFVVGKMRRPCSILDPAAGRCEFINAAEAPERWAVDIQETLESYADRNVRTVVGSVLECNLPKCYFGGVFVSNFLEHLESPKQVAHFLDRMYEVTQPGGRLVVLGPNFRYCTKEYFDCADHILPLTHVAVAEHLYAAGFDIAESVPAFLPYSFRSALPASAALTRLYLSAPLAWRLLGKQFLVIARKPA